MLFVAVSPCHSKLDAVVSSCYGKPDVLFSCHRKFHIIISHYHSTLDVVVYPCQGKLDVLDHLFWGITVFCSRKVNSNLSPHLQVCGQVIT